MPTIDFVREFKRLTGYQPFGWQRRLFEEWLSVDRLPPAVDIPTGLGKTSLMALWLLARAADADLPRRLVYVVDRRAVVDQATRFAEQLRSKLSDELAVKLGLKQGAGSLPISTLRGGFADNRGWLEDPVKPAIIVGTIDMVGSRLLFEGYGVSRGMRPYHAGFLGVDTLVLLDEAHLCPPFDALLRYIEAHRDGMLGPRSKNGATAFSPPFHLISLSATGRDQVVETPQKPVFRLVDEDRQEPVVHQRLTAKKWLKIIKITDTKSLNKSLANKAIELGCGDKPSRVLVYCDKRQDALKVKELIDRQCKQLRREEKLTSDWVSELLVGARRVYERTGLENWLEQNGFLGNSGVPEQRPVFLIATSAGEVGVDLDADHMVCDLVAYERMVQRLGRVNRRGGKDRKATIDVFAVSPPEPGDDASKAKKNEYEKKIKKYKEYKQRLAALEKLPCIEDDEDDHRDASPSAITALKSNYPDAVNKATTPMPLYPALTRPLVDSWAMTSLKQHEGRPEVSPWLRGWEKDEPPQTSVVWRKHLPYVQKDNDISVPSAISNEFFKAAPVHTTERLQALTDHLFNWLCKRANQISKPSGDHKLAIRDEEIVAILMGRDGEYRESASFGDLKRLAAPATTLSKSEKRTRDEDKGKWKKQLLPDALLVLDTRIGGLRDGMLDEKSEVEATAADTDGDWRENREDPSDESSRPVIRFRVEKISGSENGEGLNRAVELEGWRHVRTFETHFDAWDVAQHGLVVYKWSDDTTNGDSLSILSAPQTLTDHAEEVADRARDLAIGLGLVDDEIEALTIAARSHDDGKATARWQNAMNAPKDGRPYAKTCGGGNWRLLEGYRHEFGSLLRAERGKLPDRTRDLILHLITAHHGNARPLISSAGCEDGPPSLLETKAGEAALRFARLQKQYGPWGLAWREAILRAADQSVSREWSERHGKHAND